MRIDYQKRHIETEKRFYSLMNSKKTFILTLIIVGLGSFFLYIQYWSIDCHRAIELWFWTLIVVILFVALTLIGYSMFEYERKKYTEK